MPSKISSYENLRKEVVARRRILQLQRDFARTVQNTTNAFDGKVVNKRIWTAISAALPNANVYYNGGRVGIWQHGEHGLPYEERMEFQLSQDEKTLRFSQANFETGPLAPYLCGQSKAEAVDAKLRELPELVNNYNAAVDALEAAREAFGPELRWLIPR